MSNQKDQAPTSPTQSTGLPLKKRDFSQNMPSNSNNDYMSQKKNIEDLRSLKDKAYYDVLQAFIAESPSISSSRIQLMRDLMKECGISHKTHSFLEKNIKSDPLIQQLWKTSMTSDEKEKHKLIPAANKQKFTAVEGNPFKLRTKANKEEILEVQEWLNIAPAKIQHENIIAPAKIQDENVIAPAKIQDGKVIAPPKIQQGNVTASEDSPVASWGQVSPESLVRKWAGIRLPGEEDYTAFFVTQYDAETGMHHLVPAESRNELNDPCDWIDVRYFPGEDIKWQPDHPGFPIRNTFLKSGETLLHTTSTTLEKKQIREVGKSATGIPIIKTIDKGKGIAK